MKKISILFFIFCLIYIFAGYALGAVRIFKVCGFGTSVPISGVEVALLRGRVSPTVRMSELDYTYITKGITNANGEVSLNVPDDFPAGGMVGGDFYETIYPYMFQVYSGNLNFKSGFHNLSSGLRTIDQISLNPVSNPTSQMLTETINIRIKTQGYASLRNYEAGRTSGIVSSAKVIGYIENIRGVTLSTMPFRASREFGALEGTDYGFSGTTGEDGMLELWVPANARLVFMAFKNGYTCGGEVDITTGTLTGGPFILPLKPIPPLTIPIRRVPITTPPVRTPPVR